MSGTLERVRELAREGRAQPSNHARIRLMERAIRIADIMESLESAVPVEDYPHDPKGPSVLVLQRLRDGAPLHVVWGILDTATAVMITVYRPNIELWSDDFLTRKS